MQSVNLAILVMSDEELSVKTITEDSECLSKIWLLLNHCAISESQITRHYSEQPSVTRYNFDRPCAP